MTTVTLTWAEVWQVSEKARMRAIKNLQHGLEDRNGDTGMFGFDYHFLGCMGECALAKFLNVYWSGNIGDFKASDVGKFQVRACSKEKHRLILHEWDKSADIFVSALVVRSRLPEVDLRGWIYGSEGKLKEYWRAGSTGRLAFFVDRPLNPMEELKR